MLSAELATLVTMASDNATLLWGVFVLLFICMAAWEWRAAAKGIEVPEYDLGFSDMNEAQSILRTAIIKADKASHRIAATSYTLAAIVALLSLALSAGASASRSASDAHDTVRPSVVSAPTDAPAETQWPCSFLTATEMSAITGEPISGARLLTSKDMMIESPPQQATCAYSSTGPYGDVLLSVERDGATSFQIEFRKPWAPGDVHRYVPGLGDAAVLKGCNELRVLDGTDFVRVSFQLLPSCAETRAALTGIATRVLFRLQALTAPSHSPT